MDKNTGGPAFPAEQHETNDGNWNQTFDPGMTLRDYFAAHAPADPQPWFTPVMPPKPQSKWVDENGREYASPFEAERAVGFDQFWDENRDAVGAWETERAKARFTQWPYAWADEQIKERNK